MSEKHLASIKRALNIAVNVGCGFEGDAEDAAELLTLITGLESRIAELSQAVGLITTLKPTMVMDVDHPLDMAKEVEAYVTARIAELEKAQRWIPVNEPPKESGEYFTLSDLTYYKGCAGTSMYDKSINHWWDDGTVTHWMSIPKPPEVQE